MANDAIATVDPRGKPVVLTQERYHTHILRNHPELADIELIRKTIESPDLIVSDLRDQLTEVYYCRGLYPGYPHVWVRVVVKHEQVVTAFLVRQMKKGEPVRWTREP